MTLSDEMTDDEMASDAAWEPVFSPYHGEVVPCWVVTQEARMRIRANGELKDSEKPDV